MEYYTPNGWMEGLYQLAHTENVVSAMNLDNSSNTVAELMNSDAYVADQMIPSFVWSPPGSSASSFSPCNWLKFCPYDSGSDAVFSLGENQLPFVDHDVSWIRFRDNTQSEHYVDVGKTVIPRPLMEPLTERMLRALHLLKGWSTEGILAQVWVPIKSGDEYILTTSQQPYLSDHQLSGYREVSKLFTFSTKSKPGSFQGLPGRVFTSRIPEWTSNVMYYNKAEYLRIKYANDHEVRGSVALPIFEDERSCCAVLELVTMTEKSNFDLEIEHVCRALEAVNLRSKVPPKLHHQTLSNNRRAALVEITNVLCVLCHTHQLPLALTWIPCSYIEGSGGETVRVRDVGVNKKCVLCIDDTACYAHDREMESFVHACAEHCLEEGQGIAGKAFQSNHPFFYPDVKYYHVNDYPLVHHARKLGLNAAIAIRLRSTYTGDSDYILELFLPLNIKGCIEHQILLNNLSITMQRICKSLRTVSHTELLDNIVETLPERTSCRSYEQSLIDGESTYVNSLTENASELVGVESSLEQPSARSKKQMEKERNLIEKHITLGVLQKYFSGSLKDAARSVGVCPTTLKRICRQYGIARWPSRKINKVTRSLKKIQSVLESVEGVEGGLRFDPTAGGFVAASSILHIMSPSISSGMGVETIRVEKEEACLVDGNQKADTNSCKGENKSHASRLAASEVRLPTHITPDTTKQTKQEGYEAINETDTNITAYKDDGVEHNRLMSSGMTDSSNGSGTGSMMKGSSPSCDNGESKVTIKATYKDDTTRFKFKPAGGCIQLYEVVAERFKLYAGRFQLRYVDDEDEWVMLASDSDLLECVEISEFMRRHSVKIMVSDMPNTSGSSSGSSSGLLGRNL